MSASAEHRVCSAINARADASTFAQKSVVRQALVVGVPQNNAVSCRNHTKLPLGAIALLCHLDKFV
jgi:hypothetical protein